MHALWLEMPSSPLTHCDLNKLKVKMEELLPNLEPSISYFSPQHSSQPLPYPQRLLKIICAPSPLSTVDVTSPYVSDDGVWTPQIPFLVLLVVGKAVDKEWLLLLLPRPPECPGQVSGSMQ